jgi:hypothetical protein
MADLQPTDAFVVNRAGTDYSVLKSAMATVQDSDLLLINRGGVDYKATYADVKKGFGPQNINPAPGDWTFNPAIVGGTGTKADPFVITPETVPLPGGTVQSAQTLTLTGLIFNDLVEWTDFSVGAGNRFKQLLGLVPLSGQVDLKLNYADTPASTANQAYTGDLQIGTTYFRWVVTQVALIAPDVNTVTLSDVAGGGRFTSTAFPVSATMVKDGTPKSDKKLKAYVEGALKSVAQSSAIVDIGPKPPTYFIQRSLRFDGGASLTRGAYAGTGTMALWYKSDLPNTAQTIMAGLPQVTPGNSDWNFLIATGVTPAAIGNGFRGYLADVQFVDGQTLAKSDFCNPDGTAKAYGGTYGTNGFHLDFSDNSAATASALGKDTSGNGNNWTPNNLSVTAGAGNDSLVDSPTSYGTNTGVGGQVRGNYATLNPLDNGGLSLANGNLDLTATSSADLSVRADFAMTSGKWYWEVTATDLVAASSTRRSTIGVALLTGALPAYVGDNARSWGYINHDGRKITNNSPEGYGATWATGAVIGVSFDADTGSLTFYKNGTSQGTAYTGLASGSYAPVFNVASGSAAVSINFGQRAFAYTAPSGFRPLIKAPGTVLTLTDNSQLVNFKKGDAVTEVKADGTPGDATGTIGKDYVPADGNALTLSASSGTWDVGSKVKGPVKTPSGGGTVKLYCKLNAAGAVSDLQSADPGFTAWTPTGTGPYTGTVTFPATLPSGQPPDTDLPAGTTLTVEVEAGNTAGTDSAKSNTITPA